MTAALDRRRHRAAAAHDDPELVKGEILLGVPRRDARGSLSGEVDGARGGALAGTEVAYPADAAKRGFPVGAGCKDPSEGCVEFSSLVVGDRFQQAVDRSKASVMDPVDRALSVLGERELHVSALSMGAGDKLLIDEPVDESHGSGVAELKRGSERLN
jgi:hypothetical protein